MLVRSYLHNKIFILAHSNQLYPLFSQHAVPKEQQSHSLKDSDYDVARGQKRIAES